MAITSNSYYHGPVCNSAFMNLSGGCQLRVPQERGPELHAQLGRGVAGPHVEGHRGRLDLL